jgi:peptidylprolyl isomerase
MSEAKKGDTVKVHYTGKTQEGELFDSSADRDPLEFVLGTGQVISGFDAGIEGMAKGDTKTITLPPEEAYGEPMKELVLEVPRAQFPADIDPEEGLTLELRGPDGDGGLAKIIGISEETITLDANHPLAGKTLVFEVTLVEIA